jgi:hypothetical protein
MTGFQTIDADRAAAQTGLSRADITEIAQKKSWNKDRITPEQVNFLREVKQNQELTNQSIAKVLESMQAESNTNSSGFSGTESGRPQEPGDVPDGSLVIARIRDSLTQNVAQLAQNGQSLVAQHDSAVKQIANWTANEISLTTGQAKFAVCLEEALTGKKTAPQESPFALHNCLVFESPRPSVHCVAAQQLPSTQPIALKSAAV